VTTARATSDPRIGSVVLGRYRLVRYLASGGMGAIYLARAEGAAGFVRPVVIKRSLRIGDDQVGRMFAREARILSRLRHPGIVSILDFAEESGDYVMVLDYVHGYSLSDWAKYLRKTQRALPLDVTVLVMMRTLEALQYAHTLKDASGEPLGIVHRDVKPSNVLVDVQGDVKLADFGIARTDTDVTEVSVSDTTLKGTFPYMAPELFARAKPSPATDVYSAAVTLYALLTGTNPFSSADVAMTVGRVLHHEPEPLHHLRTDVPESLSWVVSTGMSKMPELRYPSAEAFATALRGTGVLEGDVDARFRKAVASDFGDPELSSLLDVDSLAERAEAWSREVGSEDGAALLLPLPAPEPTQEMARTKAMPGRGVDGPTAIDLPTAVDDVATVAGRPRSLRPATPPPVAPPLAYVEDTAQLAQGARRSRRTGVLIVAAAVGVATSVFVWALRQRGRAPEPTVVNVIAAGDVRMENAAGPAASPPSAPTPAVGPDAAVVEVPAVPADATRSAEVGSVREATVRPGGRRGAVRPARTTDLALNAKVTEMVRQRESQMRDCLAEYQGRLIAAPKLVLEIDERGKVTSADLEPGTLAPTTFGRCLLDVARTIPFGPLPEPLSVRVPIRFRK